MNLVSPTDFEILRFLCEEGRNNAVNLAAGLERDRSYINTRLPVLADYGLLDRIGPAPASGLYEITAKGRLVVDHSDRLDDESLDFDAFIDERLAAAGADG